MSNINQEVFLDGIFNKLTNNRKLKNNNITNHRNKVLSGYVFIHNFIQRSKKGES